MPNDDPFDQILARVEGHTRAARLRTVVFTLVPAVAAFLLLAYSIWSVNTAAERVTEIEAQAMRLTATVEATSVELEETRQQLTASRQAVGYVRDAINRFHAGQYARAIALYDEAIALDSLNAYVLNLRGYAQFKANRLEEAVSSLEQSVAVDPGYAYGYFDLARVQCKNGQPAQARESINRALALRPELRETMRRDGEFRRLCQAILSSVIGS